MEQTQRVALVTGGGRGIGKGIALGLAEDGLDVAITYRKGKEAADETAGGGTSCEGGVAGGKFSSLARCSCIQAWLSWR